MGRKPIIALTGLVIGLTMVGCQNTGRNGRGPYTGTQKAGRAWRRPPGAGGAGMPNGGSSTRQPTGAPSGYGYNNPGQHPGSPQGSMQIPPGSQNNRVNMTTHMQQGQPYPNGQYGLPAPNGVRPASHNVSGQPGGNIQPPANPYNQNTAGRYDSNSYPALPGRGGPQLPPNFGHAAAPVPGNGVQQADYRYSNNPQPPALPPIPYR